MAYVTGMLATLVFSLEHVMLYFCGVTDNLMYNYKGGKIRGFHLVGGKSTAARRLCEHVVQLFIRQMLVVL